MSDLFSAVDVTFCFNAHSWRKTVGDSLRYCTARIASIVMWKLLSCVRPQFFYTVLCQLSGLGRGTRRPPHGAACWNRTSGLWFWRPLLCQLSEYGMKKARGKTALCLKMGKRKPRCVCIVVQLVIVVKVIVNILGIFTEGIVIPVFIKAFVHDQIVKRFKQPVNIVNIQRNFRQFSLKEFSGVVTHFYQFDHLVS